MLADHDELIDAEARRPLTWFAISQKRGSRVLRQRKRTTITATFEKRAAPDALKGFGELLLAQADALRASAADN
jgi:hypothetical protein